MAKRKKNKQTEINNEETVDLSEEEKSLKKFEILLRDKIRREIKDAFKREDVFEALIWNYKARMDKYLEKVVDNVEMRTKEIVKEMENVRIINQNVEATLCNVLLAIRQNEYLQAWYPAQQGYPEMKVTGKHPIKIKREKK